jgi:hypothetical protein
VTCTKTEPKNDLFLNCRRKTKELSKKELSNVAPASLLLSLPLDGAPTPKPYSSKRREISKFFESEIIMLVLVGNNVET